MSYTISIKVCETEFGSSTQANVTIENDKIVAWEDTSHDGDNYPWDGWNNYNPIGKTCQEFIYDMLHWFDNWTDEYRRPFIGGEFIMWEDWYSNQEPMDLSYA